MIGSTQLAAMTPTKPKAKSRKNSRHSIHVTLIEDWAKGSPFGYKQTKHDDNFSLILFQVCPFRPEENDGGAAIRVWKNGKVEPNCKHSKCQGLTLADLETAIGSPCPVCQEPVEVLAKLALDHFNCFYAVDTDERFVWLDGKYLALSREAAKTILLTKLKTKAREIGFKLDDKGLGLVLREIQSRTQIMIGGRPPQWWTGQPVISSPAWDDANHVFVVGNGMLNPVAFATGEPHFCTNRSPALFHRFASEVNYDPQANHRPNWEKYLRDLEFSDDELRNLQEAMGFAVFYGFPGQYIILTEGAGGGGKGVYMLATLEIAGTYGLSREIDQALRGFGQADMQGRTVFAVPEAETEDSKTLAKFVTLIKRYSGGDKASVDVKHGSYVELTHLPTPLLNSNDILAHIKDSQGSILRRLVILYFHKKIQNPDMQFFDKLKPEMSAILNWCLEGFRRLYNRGHFELPESSRAALQSFAESSSPLQAFVDDHIQLDRGSCVSSDALYKLYDRWHNDNGGDHINQKSFPGTLSKLLAGVKPPRRMVRPKGYQQLPQEPITKGRVSVIEGIRVVNLPA